MSCVVRWTIANMLMSAPDMLLLDEPSLGLSPLMCSELLRSLARVRATGVGTLLVEQNAGAVSTSPTVAI